MVSESRCDEDEDVLTAGLAGAGAGAGSGSGAGAGVFSASAGFAFQLLTRPATPPLIPATSWEKEEEEGISGSFLNLPTSPHPPMLTLTVGAGLSEALLMLPFSHMLLMLRVPPVGISATPDLWDFTSLFPCGPKGQGLN